MEIEKETAYEVRLEPSELDHIIGALIAHEKSRSEMTEQLIEVSEGYGY